MTKGANDISRSRAAVMTLLHELPNLALIQSVYLLSLYILAYLLEINCSLNVAFYINILFAVLLLFRKGFKNKILIAGLHVLSVAVYIYAVSGLPPLETITSAIFALITAGVSLDDVLFPPDPFKTLFEQKRTKLAGCCLVCFLLAFGASFIKNFAYYPVFPLSAMLCAICLFIFHNMSRVDAGIADVYQRMSSTGGIRRLRRFNNIMSVIAVSAYALCAILVFAPDYSHMPRLPFINFDIPIDSIPKEYTPGYKFDYAPIKDKNLKITTIPDPAFFDFKLPPIPKQAIYAAAALVAVSVLPAVLFLLRRRKKSSGSIPEAYSIERAKGAGIRLRRPSFARSINERIRRLFYKKVEQHMGRGLRLYRRSTPVTIALDISKAEDISELEKYYELARYSNITVSRDDFSKLKRK